MKKQLSLLLAGATLSLVGVFLVNQLAAAQEPAEGPLSPEAMQQVMIDMMKAAQPGPEHEKLMAMAGEWDTKIKMKMDPTGPWENHSGHSKIQKALGGRYLIEKFSAEMGSMGSMEGLQILGYSNLSAAFESIWMDTMSTWPVFSKGNYNQDGKLALSGLMKDVITPEGRVFRHVTTAIDKDHYLAKMYDTIPPMGEVLVMEIEYTRVP